MKINDEDKIQVSIITTVFNAKDFLSQSIESIRNQTFGNYEHLIINDGSTDGTKEYLDMIDDSRIKVIHLERSGRGVALNRGLYESKGKYIAILDADDYSSKSRLELQTEILNENKDCDLISTSFGIHGVDELPEGRAGAPDFEGRAVLLRQIALVDQARDDVAALDRVVVVGPVDVRGNDARKVTPVLVLVAPIHDVDHPFGIRVALVRQVGRPIMNHGLINRIRRLVREDARR